MSEYLKRTGFLKYAFHTLCSGHGTDFNDGNGKKLKIFLLRAKVTTSVKQVLYSHGMEIVFCTCSKDIFRNSTGENDTQ